MNLDPNKEYCEVRTTLGTFIVESIVADPSQQKMIMPEPIFIVLQEKVEAPNAPVKVQLIPGGPIELAMSTWLATTHKRTYNVAQTPDEAVSNLKLGD